MRLITLNVNGIRSASSKGFFEWLKNQNADIVCLQETRIQSEQLTQNMLSPETFGSAFEFAEKKGYSGVGIYFKKKPDRIKKGIGNDDIDKEGRFIQVDFGNLSVISLYLPSGSSGDQRQNFKFRVLEYFEKWLRDRLKSKREFIICGDLNIAHKRIDLKNWKSNQKNSGFLPEEREWMTKFLKKLSLLDVFRLLNKNTEQFTWWSNRGRAWEKNVGWRIDYQIATRRIGSKATAVSIYKETRFSDHSPLIIDYEYKI
tara:strand:- start:109 stop:882 length:774 start_codon:yes stop_codon:yes gene_type:complete